VNVKVLYTLSEIEYCIANKLPWAMESSLSSAVDFNYWMREMFVSSQAGFIPSPADRVDRSMFEKKNDVLYFLVTSTLDKVFLKIPNLLKI
jgi:hypothetical protein